jgi:hypothetical protein
MKIDGACHCGAIAYEAEVDPGDVGICHCADCQTLAGTAFRTSVSAARENFRILSGEPAIYVKTAESGAKRVQAFCPRCGTPIYATAFDDPDAAYNIRTGTARQRDALVPKQQIWTRSAQRWIKDIASIPGSEKEPRD